MAIKKCPKCQYVAEDETLSICPECEAELVECEEKECEAQSDAVAEETANPEENAESAENADADENTEEQPAKSKTGYIIAIAALVVLILAGIAFIGISYFTGSKLPTTIDVKSFGKDDISGMYTSETTGKYYEFTVKDTTVQIPDETAPETDPVADSAASSDASASSDATEPEPKTIEEIHHGTFVSAYTESYIQKKVYEEYIARENLTEDFEIFVKDKKLASDDYEKYIKDKKLESKVQAFDDELGVTAYYSGNSTSGTWKYEDGLLMLYSSTGEKMFDFQATKNGLVNTQTYFKGEAERGDTMNATFSCVAKDIDLGDGTTADITQSLVLYDDGNFILIEKYSGEEGFENYAAGKYEINGTTVTIDLQGQKNDFSIIDGGLTLGLFNK